MHLFTLLSEKFDNDSLSFIPNFFSSENYRFSRTEFFNYWSALEILLGNPERNIRESLVSAYELFFPEEKNIEECKSNPQKTISKLWAIRNQVVHNGEIQVSHGIVRELENTVKSLFHKIFLSRISDKFSISVKVDEYEES